MPRLFVALIAAVVAGDLLLGAATLRYLPASTPVHWSWRGEVDRYGSPGEVAFAMPGVMLVLGGELLAIAPLSLKS